MIKLKEDFKIRFLVEPHFVGFAGIDSREFAFKFADRVR